MRSPVRVLIAAATAAAVVAPATPALAAAPPTGPTTSPPVTASGARVVLDAHHEGFRFRYGTAPKLTVYVTKDGSGALGERASGAIVGVELLTEDPELVPTTKPVVVLAPKATGRRAQRTLQLPTLVQPRYIVRVTATYGTGSARVTSVAFDNVYVGHAVSAHVSRKRVRAGARVTVSGRVVPGQQKTLVSLQRRVASRRWLDVASTTVGPDGRYSIDYRVVRRTPFTRVDPRFGSQYRIKSTTVIWPVLPKDLWVHGWSRVLRIAIV
jgi:hypothetical protein